MILATKRLTKTKKKKRRYIMRVDLLDLEEATNTGESNEDIMLLMKPNK